VEHQKLKHLKCDQCGKRLATASGLVIHTDVVHKEKCLHVHDALPGRSSVDFEIYGMKGIPQKFLDARAGVTKEAGGEPQAKRAAHDAAGQPAAASQQQQQQQQQQQYPPQHQMQMHQMHQMHQMQQHQMHMQGRGFQHPRGPWGMPPPMMRGGPRGPWGMPHGGPPRGPWGMPPPHVQGHGPPRGYPPQHFQPPAFATGGFQGRGPPPGAAHAPLPLHMGVGGVPAVAATSSTAAAAAGATAPLAAAAAAAGPAAAAAAAAAAPPSIVTAGAEQMVFDDSDGMSMEERRAMTPKYRFGEVQIKQQIEERALSLDERLAAALKGAS